MATWCLCGPNQTGAIVTFNYPVWLATFPEFDAVPESTAGMYWAQAGLYLNNAGYSPVPSNTPDLQSALLNLLTAHIAQLQWTPPGQQPSGLVGRISSATEGSVSVSTELPNLPAAAAWFSQTRYGLQFWQATAAWRTMRYFPGRPNTAAVVGGGAGGGVGPWGGGYYSNGGPWG